MHALSSMVHGSLDNQSGASVSVQAALAVICQAVQQQTGSTVEASDGSTGSSTHNERIKRMWRDVHRSVTSIFATALESEGILISINIPSDSIASRNHETDHAGPGPGPRIIMPRAVSIYGIEYPHTRMRGLHIYVYAKSTYI